LGLCRTKQKTKILPHVKNTKPEGKRRALNDFSDLVKVLGDMVEKKKGKAKKNEKRRGRPGNGRYHEFSVKLGVYGGSKRRETHPLELASADVRDWGFYK